MSNNSGVKFENEWRSSIPPRQPSKMIQWVMKYSGGLVKDEKQANYVLLGFAAAAIIAALFLIFSEVSEIPPPPPTPFQESNL